MKKAILGKKIGMTQIFDEKGKVIPVTAIEVGPCTVVQIKTVDNDGYQAVKLGFGEVKESKLTKPKKGEFKKASLSLSENTMFPSFLLNIFPSSSSISLPK